MIATSETNKFDRSATEMNQDLLLTLQECRLTAVVVARVGMTDEEAAACPIWALPSISPPFWNRADAFDNHLRDLISRYQLDCLFQFYGPGRYHHAIRPSGYDYFEDEVSPEGMERWRADFRSMASESQMIAATIIWLFRGGKDNRWLRRVPCTWSAAEALALLRHEGALDDWSKLMLLYPGW